jgi:Transposase IS200 like
MSVHSYSRCWIHLIWGTLSRQRTLNRKAASGLSRYLLEYADEQDVYMKINFVNPDHVHADRSSHWVFDREDGATLKRKFFSLGEFKRAGYGKICVGQRLWSVLGITFQYGPGSTIHRRLGRTSSCENVHRRIARVYRSSRALLARRMKPLKRLTTCSGA